jgi:hypothetical protein
MECVVKFCATPALTEENRRAYKNGQVSISGGAPLHTGNAVHSASSFPHLIHELHATCPHCGRMISIPQAAVHNDGTARGYCSKCRTEVFEASLEN